MLSPSSLVWLLEPGLTIIYHQESEDTKAQDTNQQEVTKVPEVIQDIADTEEDPKFQF